ncbi:MAG TPA: carbamoyltransferase HypF [Anaerolineales bacterium]|nr:carbamoyltransferase HypF [Anaerolineales bacterium]
MRGANIHVSGIVQGVGFRPFVYNLALRSRLTGWVRNTSAGVDIAVDGAQDVLESFVKALREEAPPLARIDDFSASYGPAAGFSKFEILHSEAIPEAFQPISPDVAVCDDCLSELFDPADRRYRYPFINCTNCGPRFTIIKDIPYDRPKTTMAGFPLCEDCAREYQDPMNRRFHAQPVACPVCGPRVWLERQINGSFEQSSRDDEAVQETRSILLKGGIAAVKGLGGFHLACDATNAAAVTELRRRKLRVDKPFALMMLNMKAVEQHCIVEREERKLLESAARPIVLLRRRAESNIAREVAPGQDWIGVMLPYTPLHYLLFADALDAPPVLPPLVMTSGNLSEEPIATDNDEARERLASLADVFLLHDRDIHIRCDDSVVRVVGDSVEPAGIYPLRRSRGYAPFPVKLPWQAAPLLAAGAELKNTFCITNRDYAFLSHHIGDMENYETLQSFEQGIAHFEHLFRVTPEAIAYDLHPNYLASRYAVQRAQRENLEAIGVQHHHAHIAACMAEHGLDGSAPVIGVAFDGTGYGDDGAIWGGEFLVADYMNYRRALHLEYFPLPGGDAAIRHPARIALALLWSLGIDWDPSLPSFREFGEAERSTILALLQRQLNTPSTSSMGRLFDAAAALAGVRQVVNYEAQAAIEFEAMARESDERLYRFDIGKATVDVKPAVVSLLSDVRAGVPAPVISSRFHDGLAHMVSEACMKISRETAIKQVVLSGGVWQNITLLRRTLSLLGKDGFEVYIHRAMPANDGGLSLGQAAIAAQRLRG